MTEEQISVMLQCEIVQFPLKAGNDFPQKAKVVDSAFVLSENESYVEVQLREPE